MARCIIKKLSIVCLIFALGVGFTAGCASMKPYDYKNEADEQKSGPGLISGEKGEMTIFRIPDKSKESEKTQPSTQTENDIEYKLEKLNNLLKKNLITQEDYDKKKEALLNEFISNSGYP
jgi:hypothetical protein